MKRLYNVPSESKQICGSETQLLVGEGRKGFNFQLALKRRSPWKKPLYNDFAIAI